MILKCFCGYSTNSTILYTKHIKSCSVYQNFKSNYLNTDKLYQLYMIQRMTYKEIFTQYPYNMFSRLDKSNIKKLCNFEHLWDQNGKRYTKSEINSVLTYEFLYENYIVKCLYIHEICELINHKFTSSMIHNRLKELKIPIHTKKEISSSDKFLSNRNSTNKRLYGDESPIRLEKFKNKRKQNWKKKWGTDHPLQSEKGKQKYLETNMKLFHGASAFSNPEIYKKSRDSLSKNKTYLSKISIELFDSISENFSKDISDTFIYMTHSGEVVVKFGHKHFSLDFSCIINNCKIDIEFNGDYYHRNPLMYKPDDSVPFETSTIKTAKDLWNYDKLRNNYLESIGYNILVIWENDYRKNKKDIVDKCVSFIKNKCRI